MNWKQYFEKIKPCLGNLIDERKKSGGWKTDLTIKIKGTFMQMEKALINDGLRVSIIS